MMSNILSIVCVLGLYSLALKFSYLNFKNRNNIILTIFSFSLIIFFIYIVNSYLFIFNISSKIFSIFIFLISLFYSFTFLKKNYSQIFIFVNNNFKNKLTLLSIASFFILSYLQPSDEDSLRYHLEIPQKIIDGTFYENIWFDYITIGTNEFINLFGLQFEFLNTSSVLNFIYLLFVILSNNFFFQKKNIGSDWLGNTLILSSPYVIAVITSQKLYFAPSYIVAYSIAYLYINKNQILYRDILLIISLNIFAVVTKSIFFPYLLIVILYSLFILKNNIKKKINLIIFIFIFSLIAYLPIGIIKYKIYQDPFLPVISLNKLNFHWWTIYSKEVLTASQMDFTDQLSNIYKVLLIPIKLIIPLRIEDLFKTLGLGIFFLIFLEYKQKKYLYFFILLFILSALILNNYQSRWFFPLLLITSIFVTETKFKILSYLAKCQFLFSLTIIVPFSLAILTGDIFSINKKMFSQQNIIDVMNNKYNNKKYFSNLNSYFYQKNEIPVYITQKNILIKYDPDFFKKKNEIKLFLYDEKDGDFKDFTKKNFLCGSYKIIEEFDYNTRRFFIVGKKQNVKLYKFLC